MTAAAAALHQRSQGEIVLRVETTGLTRLREQGAAKVRLHSQSREAILINTGGGLAGGDAFGFDIGAGEAASLTLSTQAAERVYRSLGPPAIVTTHLNVDNGATLFWVPQETILFDGAALTRQLAADLADDARFLAVESFIFGRIAMGEKVASVNLRDRWRVRRGGKLIFADDIAIDGELRASPATLGQHRAMATVLLTATDAEANLDAARAIIGASGGASAWSGKLVARLVARDGFDLRKVLIPLLHRLAGGVGLPKVWSL